MKKYNIPVMNISEFERENVVVTQSGLSTALDDAKEAIANNEDFQHTFTVDLYF
ncbi:MAG: hypothetical protein IJH94_05815 [Clostridia bacterium]|nr:hypothetical protein [Clostridia bacterium]